MWKTVFYAEIATAIITTSAVFTTGQTGHWPGAPWLHRNLFHC